MTIKITLLDEVNCYVEGLTDLQTEYIIEKTKIPIPGAFMTAEVKTGNSDGKESLFREDGLTFQYMLPQVLEILEDDLEVDPNSIDFVDERLDMGHLPTEPVDADYVKEETGFSMRKHQLDAVNIAIQERMGVLNAAVNAGKTAFCLAMSKYFDPYLRSIILVPTEYLVNQTYDAYKPSDLNVKAITKKIKPKDRAKAISGARHIIMTTKLFLNCKEMFDGEPMVLLYDEGHKMGEQTMDAVRYEMRNCPIRISMTGSFPKEKLKAEKIKAHMGGDIFKKVTMAYLVDKGYSSKTTIEMVQVHHQKIEELSQGKMWDWESESQYLTSHRGRVEAIAEYLKGLTPTNTLVLCHPGLGRQLCEYFDGRMITDETHDETRREWFEDFDSNDDTILHASFGTAATGISVNRIFRIVAIDVGKNETYIVQGIGRGMRLDGEKNEIEVIDISSNSKYSERHRKDRIKIYKREKLPFRESEDSIIIQE